MILIYLNPFHILTKWLLGLSFHDYTAVIVQIVIFWVVTLCSTFVTSRRPQSGHLSPEKPGSFTSVTINTRCHSSEQLNLILRLYEDVATLSQSTL
jgi:hypothetical protein